MLVQRQEQEQELNQRINKLTVEKQGMAERVGSLQRTLSNIENEKREMERSSIRLEKDKSALKKTLDKVEYLVNTVAADGLATLYLTLVMLMGKPWGV